MQPKHLTAVGALHPRPSSRAMDGLLGAEFPILKEGFISVIDYMGTDADVVAAARTYAIGAHEDAPDTELMRHLILHLHMTPLAAYSVKLHLKLPVFLARQWIRLRTAAISGMGGRYAVLENEFYVPSNGAPPAELENMALTLIKLKAEALDVFQEYEGTGVLGFSTGVPADMPLPEVYTQLCWTVTLADLLHFLRPQDGAGEKLDVAEYTEVLQKIAQMWVPTVWESFLAHVDEGLHLTLRDRIIVQKLLSQHNNVHQVDLAMEDLHLSAGDKSEVLVKLQALGFNPSTPQSH